MKGVSFVDTSYPSGKVYKDFFEKRGIWITDEPSDTIPIDLQDTYEELYLLVRRKPRKALPRLEKIVKQNPTLPAFKNFLYIAYVRTGQVNRADRLLDKTIEEHPNYIFGFSNRIMNLDTEEEARKYEHLLGNPRDIRTLFPDKKEFHISEFVNYTLAAIHIECLIDDLEPPVERLNQLIELKQSKDSLESVAFKIARARIDGMSKKMEKSEEMTVEALESSPSFILEARTEPPTLKHSELEMFYEYSADSIDVEAIKSIFDEYGNALIPDLEAILNDTIHRFEAFEKLDEWDWEMMSFPDHALFFLGALKATDSLQVILNQFRAGNQHIDFWYADGVKNSFLNTLYLLGESQLDALKAFVFEEGINGWHKGYIGQVVAQVAIKQPERRDEAVTWFREVLEFYNANRNHPKIFDTLAITDMVGNAVIARLVELEDLIKELYEKNWVDAFSYGDLKIAMKDLHNPVNQYEIQTYPANIEEFYTKAYRERKVKMKEEESIAMMRPDTPAEELISKMWSKALFGGLGRDSYSDDNDYEESPKPLPEATKPRPKAKIGRNEPCHCGSGKKYKKCCLKKDREMA